MEKKFWMSCLLALFCCYAFGQTPVNFVKPIQVTPPSPISYQMSKYGGINTSMINGSPNIGINLLEFRAKSLSIPVSIRYSAAGIKVDQIASRVGMGWDFEGGGVISRIVYDVPDESSTHISVPANLTDPSDEAFNFYNAASGPGSVDTQPDIYNFSFGGYSGKFVIINGVVKQVVKSELKIEQNLEGFNFKITTPDGNRYYFGGAGATETSNSESTCDVHQPTFPATAWHLKKVVAYTGETINFTYGQYNCFYFLGVNETMTRLRVLESESCSTNPNPYPPQLDDQFCASKLKTFYCLLSEISSSVGGSMKFSYINRLDVPGEYLLSNIRYFSSQDSSQLNRSVAFDYIYGNSSTATAPYGGDFNGEQAFAYRAFLNKVKEYDGAGGLIKTHSFGYNDINSLPPRLSFSQDMLGLYNGKENRSHLIPQPPTNMANFPIGLADRSSDFNFSTKGMLNSITYPTGGSDTIIYEPNTVYESVQVQAPLLNVSIYGYGSGSRFAQIHTSSAFTPLIPQNVQLSGYCSFTGDPSNYLQNYHYAKIEVVDQTTNTVIFLKGRFDVDEDLNENVSLSANHTYVIRLTCYGSELLSSVSLNYRNQENTNVMQNVELAGFRVKKTITKSSPAAVADVKRYYYGTPESGFQNSSGLRNYNPDFYMRIDLAAPCSVGSLGPSPVYGVYDGLYSYATNTQYLQQSPVQYKWVAESQGEDFANGGTAHNFLIYYDTPGEPIHGKLIAGAPLSNYGIMNGLEQQVISYVKKDNLLQKVKSVETHYQESLCNDFSDNCTPELIYGYVVRRNNADIRTHSPRQEEDMRPFDAVRYRIMGSWFFADTVKTTTYGLDGSSPVVELAINRYENALHSQATSSTVISSDQKNKTVNYLYPYDVNLLLSELSSTQISALQSMMYSNRVSSPVRTIQQVNGAEIERSRIDYREWSSSLVFPEFYKIGPSAAALENRVSFYGYDPSNGNLKSQSQTDGAKACYIYSYNGQYPIAEIKNADYQTVETLLGGATAVGNFTSSNPTDAEVKTFLAPLRTSLPDAAITSFTYKPTIGMTSQTDAKGLTSYYEYDAYQRLLAIKDQNGDVVKSYEYHFKP